MPTRSRLAIEWRSDSPGGHTQPVRYRQAVDGAPPDKQLFVVYLGGDLAPGRLGEDHEVVIVVAGELGEARAAAKAKWGGTGRAHVDAVHRLDVVDGYAVKLDYTGETPASSIDPTYVPADD